MPFSHRPEVLEPEKLARMTEAYNSACAELAKTSNVFNLEDLADTIIVLAKTSDLDSNELAESAIKRMWDSRRSA